MSIPFEIMGMIDDEEEHEKLGPCGCSDYHMADCPTRTGEGTMTKDDYLDIYSNNDDWYDD